MFEFVNWLKTFAAICITNSHYADIWPISSMAFGGQLGNCLYFFLSGFCLFNIKESFPKWYVKRIIRIYPALWIVNSIDLLVGRTSITEVTGFVHCFFYPTWFHFIASIMLLYILYYVVRYAQSKIKLDIRWVMLGVITLFFVLYLLCFDKSTYHIDDVNENWVRFMFFESMLLGAWLRERYNEIEKKIRVLDIALLILFTILYLAGKLSLSRIARISTWQCFLPIILVIYIYCIAMFFIKLEKNNIFDLINSKIKSIVSFFSSITLEIYLGQTIVLWALTGLEFPISFFVVTASIIIYAWIIHKCSVFIQGKVFRRLRKD